ncbi:Syntaxin ufe1 [Psilocybe cubensis]|uniref:Syntaxin ufe1 n=2 Tax=Psilocybe cubensis TaxID=181762 RepID=A0ACB8H4W6_PSICU|nr:Syntaxin ufe1 [Psilocybe cubensis]KAH9482931.1 Syntaxin ufe1 [Psilocybe cubensis]
MPFKNITNEFREVLQERESSIPDAKRRKVSKQPKNETDKPSVDKTYIAEAYNILNHINTLTRMLANVRTAYLSIDSRISPLSRQGSRNIDLSEGGSSWANVRHLSNEERDQIDLQARVILTRCSDRVKEMEAIEKRRAELVASKTNPLTRLLPARLRQDESTLSSDVIAAHHSGITWYLSRRLAEASQIQKELQEERVKRQLERTKTLGSGAAQEALTMYSRVRTQPSNNQPTANKPPGSWLENTIAATIGVSAPPESSRKVAAYTPAESSYVSEEDDDDDIELSASQILQFETENANILKGVQDTLESVQQAESRLMDISALQMELVTHLTRQTELTDQLYEDAITTTSTVEKGNEQLREAKRRAKDGRLFILVFLIGASLSLLFLHFY